jgi:hypothetical protein
MNVQTSHPDNQPTGTGTSFSLFETDRVRIRAEELFREEVRASFCPRPAKLSARIWILLNSSFVLFLCSSVVLSGISWQYQRQSASQQRQSERERLRADSSTELRYRFILLRASLENDKMTGRDAQYVRAVFFGQEPFASGVSRFQRVSVPAIMFLLQNEQVGDPLDDLITNAMPQMSVSVERLAVHSETDLIENSEREELLNTVKQLKILSIRW